MKYNYEIPTTDTIPLSLEIIIAKSKTGDYGQQKKWVGNGGNPAYDEWE